MSKQLEIMRVLRTLPKGVLYVEADGQHLPSMEGLSKQKRFLFLTAVSELIDFVGGYQQLVDAGVAAPLMPPSQTAVSDSSPQPDETPLTPQQQAFLDRMEKEKNALKEDDAHVKEPSIIRTALPLRRPPSAQKSPPAPQKSIVQQIDAILQTHVQQHSRLASSSIHLKAGPTGSTQIEVDGQLFANPNELPDPEIRQLIQKAVQEWESR